MQYCSSEALNAWYSLKLRKLLTDAKNNIFLNVDKSGERSIYMIAKMNAFCIECMDRI
jgi:hypothetical protein